ncbi:anaerobic ribonucleoside-triphosphate reductase [Blautia wexlerae]|uniref:Anaerobic ribonucleoside-triphosphate reductase n=1 Tax=Blautia wexlerae TaxID=418240 RepID=A0A6L8SZF9_9FIRM|nr:anaerobic ribonucleoside-triphosphate reductase [Blautia wexlerae]MZL32263.1 anaerobic ribonucleoside-triphosphate reductase [Blautia wexlerae]MZT14231.1 anaerobic ribonucleoside-triphosphate reductase [Blautia wexlerae]MZT32301.1 anaerobic ribonucleoside-triphosphate reductase [Blautia wexlerae]MZT40139.1 anaerobic ribonucleoside-triphosphate reductase [Blautia wexlerae]MZT45745.1 anaerobic ribonucleoside-triphosphate reductase [Blautia wexlerae]
MNVVKKDLTVEPFNDQKIVDAVNKSASRVMVELTNDDYKRIIDLVWDELIADDIDENTTCTVEELHNAVESALDEFNPKIAKSYKDYRNYKKEFVHMMDDVFTKSQAIRYIGDKSNANTDSALVATKRSLIFNELNKNLYRKFFMTRDELQACKDGYIYIHDQSARLDTINCCLFRVGEVMKGGFEMGNVWYNEPNSLDTAFDVMGDIILSTAAQQYGGFTVPEVDKILEPYAEKSYQKYYKEFLEIFYSDIDGVYIDVLSTSEYKIAEKACEYATEKVKRDFEQGWQGIEYKLNTVGSSRGDYPFVTMTFGLSTTKFGKMASITFLNVHKEGQGKAGNKKPVLFPKLVFLYDEKLHGPGKVNEDVFNAGIECSMKTMYPDWLSLTGEGYVPSMYKKYGTIVSPMGCRAFLSPWYEKGGIEPEDENDKAIFEGRFNLGVVSLHLPMILAKAQRESRDFYEVLDYYLEMIRSIHKRTYDYIGEMKASTNPLAYCEGGFLNGYLKPDEKIRSILKPMTLSFGITALNELQELYNKKSLVEDGKFAVDVMKYINKKITQFKHEDGLLYAIYGTPAESLCGLQVEQFRKMYGIVKGVSDREYVSNSFHCHVTEDITPIQKQDLENRFWNLFNGGKIQYVRYPINYNREAVVTLIRRAMKMGYYEGVNLALSYCEHCGYEELNMDMCPKCGSEDITKIDRMNGYIGYTRVHGDTRYNKAKMAEIAERRSM